MGKQAVGNLSIVLTADAQGALTGMKLVGDAAAKLGKSGGGRNSGSQFGSSFVGGIAHNLAGRGIGAFASIGSGAHQAIRDGMEANAKRETTGLSFELLLGSKQKAIDAMKNADSLGKQGGLDPMRIMEGTRSLMGQGLTLEKSNKLMRQMSIISIATGADVGRMGTAIGQIYGKGVLRAEEVFNQLADNGFPVQEIVDTYGKSMLQFRADMEKGIVTVDVLEKTLTRLSEVKFANALDKNAGTQAGKEALKDAAYDRAAAATAKHMVNFTDEKTKVFDTWTLTMENMDAFVSGWNKRSDAKVGDTASSSHLAAGLGAAQNAADAKYSKERQKAMKDKYGYDPTLNRTGMKIPFDDGMKENSWNKFGERVKKVNPNEIFKLPKGDMTRAEATKDGLPWLKDKIHEFTSGVSLAKKEINRGIADFLDHATESMLGHTRDSVNALNQGPKSNSGMDKYEFDTKNLRQATAMFGLSGRGIDQQKLSNFDALEKSVGDLFSNKLPAAMTRGSQAAESVINNASGQQGREDRESQVKAVIEAGNKQRDKLIQQNIDTIKAIDKIAAGKQSL